MYEVNEFNHAPFVILSTRDHFVKNSPSSRDLRTEWRHGERRAGGRAGGMHTHRVRASLTDLHVMC